MTAGEPDGPEIVVPDGGGAADPVAVSVHSDGAAVPLATCLTSVSVDFGVYVFVNVQVMPGCAASGGGGTLVSTTWRAARFDRDARYGFGLPVEPDLRAHQSGERSSDRRSGRPRSP